MTQKDLKRKEREILELAEKSGCQNSYFFVTTFERYRVQLAIMDDLAKEIKDIGSTVSKEYVKGRANIYTNPAISEYNKTASAANGTVTTLLKIIDTFRKNSDDGEADLAAEMARILG